MLTPSNQNSSLNTEAEDQLGILERAIAREKQRRAAAEALLEERSRELYFSYQELESAHEQLKENKDQLVQSEKMASLGVMSAGMAHEINTPIGFVESNLNTLSEYAPVFFDVCRQLNQLLEAITDDTELSELRDKSLAYLAAEDISFLVEDTADILTETTEGISRVKEIVTGLRAFAREDHASFELLDINDCIEKSVQLASPQIANDHQITTNFTTSIPPVLGSESRLGQVFLNLLINAAQACQPGEGQITLSTRMQDSFVVVDVADNGCGISEENRKKLFQPFFTTKDVGQGTGLGLSIGLGIIEDHKGRIDVTSEEGVGTTFSVVLPIDKDSKRN